MKENNILQVNQLGIAFHTNAGLFQAVENSTFALHHGKTLAIVGESGSGKSVSSLSIMGLLNPIKTVFTSGSFRFHPSIIEGVTTQESCVPSDTLLLQLRGKRISMIFQEPMTSLNPVMTCGTQVSEVLEKHLGLSRSKSRQRVLGLFREVKLPRAESMLDQYPHELSGGQRQRVMIAMAIACEPRILIADEPTTALDVTVQREILQLLRSLQQARGMSMIFITHDFGVVEEIADEVLVMKRGEMVEHGSVVDVLTNPHHAYTQGLLRCRPNPAAKQQRLLTVTDFEKNTQPLAQLRNEKPPSNLPFLTVHNLSKLYSSGSLLRRKEKPVIAVDRVSFEIFKGETLGLVGESGCGKTTLSRMLLGLIPASEGRIDYHVHLNRVVHLNDLSNTALRRMRKDIQIIFQDPYSALNPKHSIGRAIMEPMRVHSIGTDETERKDKAMYLLERVGLNASHFDRYPHEFSGGQRQRIVIARALACNPSFIICDESVSALDVSVQAQVLNLLNDLKYEFGLTYLFISHDLRVVHYMSDRIMVMNKGEIEEIGSANEVFNHPKSSYTQQLLNAIPGK